MRRIWFCQAEVRPDVSKTHEEIADGERLPHGRELTLQPVDPGNRAIRDFQKQSVENQASIALWVDRDGEKHGSENQKQARRELNVAQVIGRRRSEASKNHGCRKEECKTENAVIRGRQVEDQADQAIIASVHLHPPIRTAYLDKLVSTNL